MRISKSRATPAMPLSGHQWSRVVASMGDAAARALCGTDATIRCLRGSTVVDTAHASQLPAIVAQIDPPVARIDVDAPLLIQLPNASVAIRGTVPVARR